MVNFWCRAFLLPKKVLRAIESWCKSFLWKGTRTQTTGAKVSWSIITLLKEVGRLGLKQLGSWNQACLMRFIWLLISGSLWIAWVKAYLVKNNSFWDLYRVSVLILGTS